MTNDKSTFTAQSRPRVHDAHYYTLKECAQLLDLEGATTFSDTQIRESAKLLHPPAALPLDGKLRRLAGVTNLELVVDEEQGFHRVYKGKHIAAQEKVLLHCYDLSAFNGDGDAGEIARRQFDVLQKLQKHTWLPSLMDSFQDAAGYPGELKYFSMIDPAAPSLLSRAEDAEWTTRQRVKFCQNAAEALHLLHAAGGEDQWIHRNLNPETIMVTADNQPLLTGLHLTKIPTLQTVAPQDAPASPYIAPEVQLSGYSSAGTQSDVFSLAASLALIFKQLDAQQNDELALEALVILEDGQSKGPAERPSLVALAASLGELLKEPSNLAVTTAPEIPAARFWSEELTVPFREENFEIITKLGSGSFGTTFKVEHRDSKTEDSFGVYVGKTMFDKTYGERAIRAYKRVRPHSGDSPCLSPIFDIANEFSANRFVGLLKWVEGDPLNDMTGILPLFAEELGGLTVAELALRWLTDLCQALATLHQVRLVHGDVSARNIIQSNGAVTLTDYDLLLKQGEGIWSPGTPLYSAPECKAGKPADPSNDVYALAATIFHVATDCYPFGEKLDKAAGIAWGQVTESSLPRLKVFFDKATAPDRKDRFDNAIDALEMLRTLEVDTKQQEPGGTESDIAEPASTTTATAADSGDVSENPPQKSDADKTSSRDNIPWEPNEVPWLKNLLKLYPGALWGNSETRGLDSSFASETYVITELENLLTQDIRERRARLVVLCGNAGDGKTALLQHLASELGISPGTSADREWCETLSSGQQLRVNLDGSGSYQGRSANEMLDNIFEPFHDGAPTEDIVHLVAVNDGRLLEWIEQYEAKHTPTALTIRLTNELTGELTTAHDHIRFIDLNERSLVGGFRDDQVSTAFLDELIDRLLGGSRQREIWQPCETCSAQNRCAARQSVKLLTAKTAGGNGDGENRGKRVRQRLYEALQGVHQHGDIHITTRELRATLSYIFFGLHYCSDLHEDPTIVPCGYYDMAFDAESPNPGGPRDSDAQAINRQGDLLNALVRLDPALEPHPRIEKYLQLDVQSGVGEPPRYPSLSPASALRRAYFEWSTAEVMKAGRTPHAVCLAQGEHLQRFREVALLDATGKAKLCEELCRG